MYKTVIFDLDGTLVNSLFDLGDAVNFALSQLGQPVHSYAEIQTFVGNGADVLIKRALPEDRQDLCNDALALFSQHYKTNMLNKTKPYDGIEDLLKNLKDKGIKTAIVSNKPHPAVKNIANILFNGLVDTAVGADLTKRRKKPAPDPVLLAMENLGAERDTTIYIGDSDVDVETAKNCGLKSIGVTWGFRSIDYIRAADYIAHTPQDIEEIVCR